MNIINQYNLVFDYTGFEPNTQYTKINRPIKYSKLLSLNILVVDNDRGLRG